MCEVFVADHRAQLMDLLQRRRDQWVASDPDVAVDVPDRQHDSASRNALNQAIACW
jgi:hypothetical protein